MQALHPENIILVRHHTLELTSVWEYLRNLSPLHYVMTGHEQHVMNLQQH